MKLAITADDYGFTEGINRAIEQCVRAGTVKVVSVMANMPHWEMVEKLPQGDISVGIHWNVTQGRPVLSAERVPSLVAADGCFAGAKALRHRARRGALDPGELAAELEAQLGRLRSAVPQVAFWNTHQNVHIDFGLYRRFVHIAHSLGADVMRNHSRVIARRGVGVQLRHPVFFAKGLVLARWARWARKQGMRMPAGRLVNGPRGAVCARLPELLRSAAWSGVAELVVHPASDLEGLSGQTHLLESRLDEGRILASSDFRRRLSELGAGLVSFSAL